MKKFILTQNLIGWLKEWTNSESNLISAPYCFVPASRLIDLSVSFINKTDEWEADFLDVFAIVLVKILPVNYKIYKDICWLVTDAPRDIFAHLMQLSNSNDRIGFQSWSSEFTPTQIHPTARIHESTFIDDNVWVGANVTIGANCSIGHAGFGFGRLNTNPARLHHTGGVFIDENCIIGSNCTIASGTFTPTKLGGNVLVDDHVHIAHNCVIGMGSTITAGTIFSGSVTVGENNWLAPNSTVKNGVVLGDNVFVGIGAAVTKSFESGVVAGNPAKKLRS